MTYKMLCNAVANFPWQFIEFKGFSCQKFASIGALCPGDHQTLQWDKAAKCLREIIFFKRLSNNSVKWNGVAGSW